MAVRHLACAGPCVLKRMDVFRAAARQSRVESSMAMLSVQGKVMEKHASCLDWADAATLRPSGGQRALNWVRWFLLSESFQYAAQLMVGIFPISFLVFIRCPTLQVPVRHALAYAVRMCALPHARVYLNFLHLHLHNHHAPRLNCALCGAHCSLRHNEGRVLLMCCVLTYD